MSAATIVRLKIALDDVKPAVLRRIEVPLAIRLDRLHLAIQAVEPDCERHLDPAQNRGLDVVERNLEADDGGGTHAATLRRSLSAAQCHGNSAARSVIL